MPRVAASAVPSTVQHLGIVEGDAKTDLSRQLSILVRRQKDGTKDWHIVTSVSVTRSCTGAPNANHLAGIHTLFSDMGGQPQFWALVANFLRK